MDRIDVPLFGEPHVPQHGANRHRASGTRFNIVKIQSLGFSEKPNPKCLPKPW